MLIKLTRLHSNENETIGKFEVDGEFICFALEDEYREEKVYGETRIPEGIYKVKLRTEGRIHNKYKKYEFHKGMLWLQDVPNFTYIYIHKGNTDKDTLGCLLTGDSLTWEGNKLKIGRGKSTPAYERLYKLVVESAVNDDLQIEII